MTDAVEPRAAWGLLIKYRNAPGGFLGLRVYPYRSDVIADYDDLRDTPGQYARDRRRGIVKAVRVTIQMAAGEDQ